MNALEKVELKQQLELTRQRLNDLLVDSQISFREIQELSEELDKLIVLYYKFVLHKNGNTKNMK